MNILHYELENFNRTSFLAAVGRGPKRATTFGTSIDVVKIDAGERLWGDLIPTNPEIFSDLYCGACIKVTEFEVIRQGRRPLWRGKVRLVE